MESVTCTVVVTTKFAPGPVTESVATLTGPLSAPGGTVATICAGENLRPIYTSPRYMAGISGSTYWFRRGMRTIVQKKPLSSGCPLFPPHPMPKAAQHPLPWNPASGSTKKSPCACDLATLPGIGI